MADVGDFYAAANSAVNGREVFRGGGAERKAAAVKHIAPIAVSESSRLHLVAVTADGRRVYFTTGFAGRHQHGAYYDAQPPPRQQGQQQPPERPSTLLAVVARPALPYTGAALGRPLAAAGPQAAAAAVRAPAEVTAALYGHGTLLLSEAADGGRGARLLVAARNGMLPLASTNLALGYGASGNGVAGGSQPGGLREMLSELDGLLGGETCAIEAAPYRCALGPELLRGMQRDELLAQVFLPAPRFVLIR